MVAGFKRMEQEAPRILFMEMYFGIFPAFRMVVVDEQVNVAIGHRKVQRCDQDRRKEVFCYGMKRCQC